MTVCRTWVRNDSMWVHCGMSQEAGDISRHLEARKPENLVKKCYQITKFAKTMMNFQAKLRCSCMIPGGEVPCTLALLASLCCCVLGCLRGLHCADCTLDVTWCDRSSSSITLVQPLASCPDIKHFLNLVHAMQGLALLWCLQNKNPIGHSPSALSPGTVFLMCSLISSVSSWIVALASHPLSFHLADFSGTCFTLWNSMAVADLLVGFLRFSKDSKVLVTSISVMVVKNSTEQRCPLPWLLDIWPLFPDPNVQKAR